MGWHARCFVFCCTPENQLVWIHYFVMKHEQNDLTIFKVALCALLWLANCPRYNTCLCINLLRVHQLAYCSCNLCPVCTNVGAVVPTSHAHNISPTVWRPLVNMSLAFKSNLFHESSLQVLLLIISDAHSTPCAHLRRAQTPFTHHY